eukprot:jgi/Ulvmu1/4755/UM020_0040.1
MTSQAVTARAHIRQAVPPCAYCAPHNRLDRRMCLVQWQDCDLMSTASCLGPWTTCSIPVPKDAGAAVQNFQLDFVVKGPKDSVDKPQTAEAYHLDNPGGYKLSLGNIRPFPQANLAPFMLVSDVDGTMIDEDDFAVQCAKDFRQYWETSATLCSSILVYNTGRSIGQLTGLLEYRQGSMTVPDAIITAVGTKVFLLNRRAVRSKADSGSWVEAEGWSSLLSQDWDLEAVKAAAALCVSDRCHWLDDGTEHPHRIALSVHKDEVARVQQEIMAAVNESGSKAQMIVSGAGDYKYLDVLSIHGGKRNAMEYVRSIFGISPERVVAAGDSGNDILMLEGESPGIVVGNAQPLLLDWAVKQKQNGRVVLADKPLAHGILEGLARHGLY